MGKNQTGLHTTGWKEGNDTALTVIGERKGVRSDLCRKQQNPAGGESGKKGEGGREVGKRKNSEGSFDREKKVRME